MRTHTCGELNKSHVGKDVTLSGWVATVRNYGKIAFIDLRDREGITQLFLNKDLAKEYSTLHPESVILVHGKVNARPANQVNQEMSTGAVEVEVKDLTLVTEAEAPLPIEVKEDTTTQIDKRLDYRFLDVRREHVNSIFLVRSKILMATVEFFDKAGFVAIQSPKLTASRV